MSDRLPVLKTHKLYVDGAFVRSESGRFSTGLHLQLGPPSGSEELAVLEPGIDYTRDFFRLYSQVCP